MFIGAMLDLGVKLDTLERELAKLPVSGYRLEAERVLRRGVSAVQFKVILEDQDGTHLADDEFMESPDLSGDRPEDADRTYAGHTLTSHDHNVPARALADILVLIEKSALDEPVKATAREIFTRLGEAESRVHGVPFEHVHFHEVGSLDAIIDIVGSAIALHALRVDRVIAAPLHLGNGFIRSSHGVLPVPAPAVANLILGVPVYNTEVQGELLTPTGAAIITTIANSYGPLPAMIVDKIGYGSGTRERDFPNVLRAFLGQVSKSATAGVQTRQRDPFPQQHSVQDLPTGYHEGPAMVLEASIDDMNPQFYEPLVESLLAFGALDVLLIPVQMKKSRPGILVHVLAHPDSVEELLAILFRDSTTLGVRTYPVTKRMLTRNELAVETPYGTVRAKIARLGEQIVNVQPEYEDCRLLALRHGVPVKTVHTAALAALSSPSSSETEI